MENKVIHNCPDGKTYEWVPRVPEPRNCPRCKANLSKKKKGK